MRQTIDTWNKKVTVENKQVTKRTVLNYYKKLWKKDRSFRDTLKKSSIFVRASYGNKQVIKRKNIKINNIKDLEKMIHEYSVEFIIPTKNMGYNSVVDVDIPKKHLHKKKSISKTIIKRIKDKKIDVSMVTDSPRGVHIFSNSNKKNVTNALKQIADKDKHMIVGKTSRSKIVLDPNESAIAVPNSLSIKGKPYKKWKKR